MLVWTVIILMLSVAGYLLTTKGLGLVEIGRMNLSRLRGLRRLQSTTSDPLEQLAVSAVIGKCESVRARWILKESDLQIVSGTRRLVEEIAGIYHAQSKTPVAEARVGGVLLALLQLKKEIVHLTRIKGVRALTQFRLRHLILLSQAWKKKEQWQQSPLALILIRYKIYFLVKWLYYLYRCLDISFWAIKMAQYIFYDVVFKIFLMRWYLVVGELALRVYREQEKEPEIQADTLLEELESVSELEIFREGNLPDEVRKIAEVSRNKILFDPWTVEWREVKDIYIRLAEDIARWHHPQEQALYEARLFNLLEGLAHFAGMLSELRTKPILNKLLNIRVAHILKIKDTTDLILDSPLMSWIKKYRLNKIVNYTTLIFKTILKKHPGAIFQHFAFSLVTEGGKRWIYLYVHDKIAAEANFIYKD
jgi:hypothetical protein